MKKIFSLAYLQYAQNKVDTASRQTVKNKIQSNFSYNKSLLLDILTIKNNI